jgi:hypothetical protein
MSKKSWESSNVWKNGPERYGHEERDNQPASSNCPQSGGVNVKFSAGNIKKTV